MDKKLALLKEKTIVALDVDTLEEAEHFTQLLSPYINKFKVGSRLFSALGPAVFKCIEKYDAKIFLDLKYHDIPSVVGSSCKVIAENHPSVFLITVHASGGLAMMAAAVEATESREDLDIVAVTALTSLSSSEMGLLGISVTLKDWAEKLGDLALDAGAAGLVCSPREVAAFRLRFGKAPILITPGIRPENKRQGRDDQTRTRTPSEAIDAGSTYLVIGRPIYQSEDPIATLKAIAENL